MVMEENLVEGDKLNFLLKRKYFTDIDILSILVFFLGLFSTFESFKINIKGANIYPYSLFFIFILIFLFNNYGKKSGFYSGILLDFEVS